MDNVNIPLPTADVNEETVENGSFAPQIEAPLAFTIFTDQTASNSDRFVSTSLAGLAHEILETTRGCKAALPWLKLAGFGDTRSINNCYRYNTNMTWISGVEGDYDGGTLTIEEGAELFRGAGVRALLYTTPSYSEAAPRWRVLCPTSRHLPPSERDGLMDRLNGVIGGGFAGESWTRSQAYYFGNIAGRPKVRVFLACGAPLDTLADMPTLPKPCGGTETREHPDAEPVLGAAISVETLRAMGEAAREACADLHYPELRTVIFGVARIPVEGDDDGSVREEVARTIWENNMVSRSLTDDKFDALLTEPARYKPDGSVVGPGSFVHYAKLGGWRGAAPGDGRSSAETFGDAGQWQDYTTAADTGTDAGRQPDVGKTALRHWLERSITPPIRLLGALLSTTSRVFLIAPTGLGKTNYSMAAGGHIALGRDFLHWRVQRPARILYIDGEMSAELMKERLHDLVRRLRPTPDEMALLEKNLIVLNREDYENMPPLNTLGGQKWMDALIAAAGPIDLIIFDNLQSLLIGQLKETDMWAGALPWVRSLTRRQIGQLWVHHANDQGKDYGDKTKEWQFDTVILLRKPEDHDPDAELVAFDLTFPKARGRTPHNRENFRQGRVTLDGDVWRFTGSSGDGGQAAEIYNTLADAGIRSMACSLTDTELAELRLPKAADMDANADLAWRQRRNMETARVKKLRQRHPTWEGRYGGQVPSAQAGRNEWRWYLPAIAEPAPPAALGESLEISY